VDEIRLERQEVFRPLEFRCGNDEGPAPTVNVVAVVTEEFIPEIVDAAELPPIVVEAVPPAEITARTPVDWGRDYGRLLILLAVPAAFLGLHLHLSRRAYIVPPSS
jgi:hypothetical protein